MFERRLRIVLALPVLCLLVVVTRLYHLQLLHGEDYAQRAEAALVSPRQYLPPLRGAVQDRYGRVLVSDEPAMDVTVQYGALAMGESYLRLVADRIRKKESAWRTASDSAATEEAKRRIGHMWTTVAKLSDRSFKELRERRDAVYRAVEGLRRHIWDARRQKGFEEPLEKVRLKEEELFHPIVRDVSPQVRTRIEVELGNWPFVRIEPSVRRVWHDGSQSLCHVLGQLGPVTPRTIDDDERKDDPLACYRASDDAGLSGVELLAEPMLRGQRGYEERLLDGELKSRQPPKDGLDVQLTLDLDLQSQIERILTEAVAAHPPSTGASCVVLDVSTREILAAVSVPTFDRQTLRDDYRSLRDDARDRPLRFRAVQERYQPGSIMKPVALLAGFANGTISATDRVFCAGALIPGASKWHCWTHWRQLPGHGEMVAEEALQHSCNVYFYTVGQRLGAPRLTDFYKQFILGPSQDGDPQRGTRLIEEIAALIPTRDWLSVHRRRGFTEADGRNYAIGQGELEMTPLQAANMFATLAVGGYKDPTLIANDGRPRPTTGFPKVSPEAWQIMRRGLWRCVNEEGGTAFKYARLKELAVCGKTGSAECVSRVTRRQYTFEVVEPDGRTAQLSCEAPTMEAAREQLGISSGAKCVRREVTQRWPMPDPARAELDEPDGAGTKSIPTHAWFAGFAPYRNPRIALAVVVEFGGGGGSTSGPLAKQVFEAILQSPHGYLKTADLASAE